MKETELNKVLNYMKQYVENKYEHDSEPMLTYKDLQLVLKEIERLNKEIELLVKDDERNQQTIIKQSEEIKRLHSIIKEVREYIKNIPDDEFVESEHFTELLEILERANNDK